MPRDNRPFPWSIKDPGMSNVHRHLVSEQKTCLAEMAALLECMHRNGGSDANCAKQKTTLMMCTMTEAKKGAKGTESASALEAGIKRFMRIAKHYRQR